MNKANWNIKISGAINTPQQRELGSIDMRLANALNSSHFTFGCLVTLVTFMFFYSFSVLSALTREQISRLRNAFFFLRRLKRKEPAKTDNKNWLCMLRARDHKKGQHTRKREENGHDTRIRLRRMCTFATLQFHGISFAWEIPSWWHKRPASHHDTFFKHLIKVMNRNSSVCLAHNATNLFRWNFAFWSEPQRTFLA